MKQDYTIVYEWDESGWWVATALELAGAFSQGRTQQEARDNVLDAIRELVLAQRAQAESELKKTRIRLV
ncbi:MAG: type II toxin-antitoxin system HicB family antitoxin [Anaerolineae bacterium]|nr:type II toxin-antitoxin system HicB family antitoxin [Anaerolineae bacterium]